MAPDESMRKRAESFGSVADDYDRLRPGYPTALFDDLLTAAEAQITKGVLEVGAGTGRATMSLARRGVDVVALEPSAGMIRVMEEQLRGEGLADRVTVREQRFDDLTAADGPFGVVVAAQSFHWARPAYAMAPVGRAAAPGRSGVPVLERLDPRPSGP